jgi:hypothetical protein
LRVRAYAQDDGKDHTNNRPVKLHKCSALHIASKNGLVSTVAKLLAIGADAALVDVVLACLFMNVNTLGD